MGVFRQRIEVGPLGQGPSAPIDAIVDTGASFTMLPGSFLERLGITPHDRARFTIADGQQVELPLGYAQVHAQERSVISLVAFGAEGTPPLLGAFTLEGLRLAVDPLGNRLVDRELYLLGGLLSGSD